MTHGISQTFIDNAYQAGIDAGARGGKLLDGGGGFPMFYAPSERARFSSQVGEFAVGNSVSLRAAGQ